MPPSLLLLFNHRAINRDDCFWIFPSNNNVKAASGVDESRRLLIDKTLQTKPSTAAATATTPTMKFAAGTLSVVVALAASNLCQNVEAFAPPARTSSSISTMSFGAVDMTAASAATDADVDVSIPYDAAAELEYDAWIAKYNKPYDISRREVFINNYKAISVMNVSAKKQARDAGTPVEDASLLALNEYADFTAEEYQAAMEGGGPSSSSSTNEAPTSTGDILGEAVAAVESQSAASDALQEAADALAEEEEKLAAQLGLESVEELEQAIDAMQGIAPDGSEMDDGFLAREARVRSAYLDWCKEYGKEADESRFPQFMSNFLEMESFAIDSGKEMVLNEYADFTEEEYKNLTEGGTQEASASSDEAAAEAAAKVAKEAEAKAAAEAAAAKAAAEKESAEKAAKAKVDAKKKAEDEAKAKAKQEAARLASMTDEERRKEIEKEKTARQNKQAKELAKAVSDAEAEIIAAAKKSADEEAKKIEAVRKVQEEAAELARAKAREWDEKQAKLNPTPKPTPPAPPKKQSVVPSLSLFGQSKKQESTPATPPPRTAKPVQAKADKPKVNIASFFGSPEPSKKAPPAVPKSPPKPTPTPAKPAAKKSAPRPTLNLASIFESKASKPAAPKKAAPKPSAPPAPKPVAKITAKPAAAKPATKPASSSPTLSLGKLFESKPAPKKKPVAAKPATPSSAAPKIDTSDPVSDAFSSFFGGSKKAPAKKAPAPAAKKAPAPAPAPAPKKAPAPSFSLFNKPPPKKTPAPSPAPAPKAAPAPSFSLFSKPAPKKAPAPAPTPAPAPKTAFSLFGSKPAAPKAAAPAPSPAPAKKAPAPSFSLFGASKPKTPAKSAATPTTPSKKAATPSRPTLSLFSSKPKPKAEPKPVAKPAPKSRPTLSIFGNASAQKTAPSPKKAAPKKPVAAKKDTIPALSKWVQNKDGSITGRVSNSPNFRNGTEITTSPVRKGAKAGSVVKTGSGSQYRLN